MPIILKQMIIVLPTPVSIDIKSTCVTTWLIRVLRKLYFIYVKIDKLNVKREANFSTFVDLLIDCISNRSSCVNLSTNFILISYLLIILNINRINNLSYYKSSDDDTYIISHS